MNQPKKLHPALRVALGVATTSSFVVTGAIMGILFVRLFVPKRGMGWDGLADALGGLMLGALLGLALGVTLAIYLAPRLQLIVLALAAVLFGAAWLTLYLTQPQQAEGAGTPVGAVDSGLLHNRPIGTTESPRTI